MTWKVAKQIQKLFPFLVGTNKYFIPLVFNVDVKDEIQKINHQINYLSGFLNSIDKKISNENFMNNAPKKVVEIDLKKQTDTINTVYYTHLKLTKIYYL